jgi:hypothetical protein
LRFRYCLEFEECCEAKIWSLGFRIFSGEGEGKISNREILKSTLILSESVLKEKWR